MEKEKLLEEIEKLKNENQEVRKLLAEKSLFISSISHEIRTPIGTLVGMTNILLEENLNQEQTEILQTMKFSADNLLKLLDDILIFSKIESENIELEEIEIYLDEFLNSIKQTFIESIKKKKLEFIINLDTKIPKPIIGDPLRLSQILNNLIGNAIKFTNSGSITLEIKLNDTKANFVNLEFSVSDTGIGIPKDKINYIFGDFKQGGITTSREFGGTGLGLAIVKKILELMESKIKVESELNFGSKFSFQLFFKIPMIKGEQKKTSELNKEIKSLKGLKLLLVEDNPSNQKVALRYLQKWDIDADLAENGIECLEKIKNKEYNLILMDLQMPKMDGYTTTLEIRKNENDKIRKIPIIALTASALLETNNKVKEAGMNDYITKPFNPTELFNTIAKYYKK